MEEKVVRVLFDIGGSYKQVDYENALLSNKKKGDIL